MSSHSFVNADEPYPHEAGEFIRRNLRDFPSPCLLSYLIL